MRAGSVYGRTLLNATTRNTRARVSRGADANAAMPTMRYDAAESSPDHASNAVADEFIARYYVAHNAQGDAMRRIGLILALAVSLAASIDAQGGRRGGAPAADAPVTILKPARVFDGQTMHEGWAVRVR